MNERCQQGRNPGSNSGEVERIADKYIREVVRPSKKLENCYSIVSKSSEPLFITHNSCPISIFKINNTMWQHNKKTTHDLKTLFIDITRSNGITCLYLHA